MAERSRSQEENDAKVVGATSSWVFFRMSAMYWNDQRISLTQSSWNSTGVGSS